MSLQRLYDDNNNDRGMEEGLIRTNKGSPKWIGLPHQWYTTDANTTSPVQDKLASRRLFSTRQNKNWRYCQTLFIFMIFSITIAIEAYEKNNRSFT
mmetsp:Transcript_37654/g.46019  ORF Transcript_37654/g.46019 Transcript_37654/m.46019 type:complete len:96 (+) Transcript_37654:62-349(+)